MARIENVSVCSVKVPLRVATSFATRQVLCRDYALARIETDDGATGIGFCYAGSSAGTLVSLAIRDLLGPLIIGQDSHSVELLWERMYQATLLQGRAGVVQLAVNHEAVEHPFEFADVALHGFSDVT